jgi:hypothetical protein
MAMPTELQLTPKKEQLLNAEKLGFTKRAAL